MAEDMETVASWDGRDIDGETFTRVLFTDLDLMEIDVRGAVFEECTFRHVRFNASTHAESAYLNCTFAGSSFFDAAFTSCKLTGSRFERCEFGLFKADGGDWSFTALPGADLRGSAFTG